MDSRPTWGESMRISSRPVVLCLAMAVILTAPTIGPARAGTMQTYIVLYSAQAVPADAARTITNAGGVFVYAYDAIGVVIARSDSRWFRDTLLADNRIENVSSTAGFAVKLRDVETTTASGPSRILSSGNPDSLSGLQWDMIQIHTPEAHAITEGSPAVLVGDIDTGLDYTHPDLAANVDDANSVNCVSGSPVPGKVAANDDNGHGTHTAGTIAAAANGIGIVGVAPNVRIAGIKAGNADGFFFPEAVVCAFVWAGTHGFNVTNNSYFADPFYLNCHNDPVQRAIWKAEQRAIRFAMSQGVTVVAAVGNFSDDLAHPTMDIQSPDNTTPVERTVHNDCVDIPAEITGVLGVSAVGNLGLKSFYSSYGVGVVEVAAPGGDSRLQQTAAAPNGRVLSTYPAALIPSCLRPVADPTGATYCYLQGTSMASPHAAGVAALVASRGRVKPGQIAATVQLTADPKACPGSTDLALYAPFPSVNNGAPQACQGGPGSNSWYGKGQVNALNAVTAP